MVAELRSEDGTTDIEIVPRAENKDVEIKEPVFTDGKCTGTTVKINKKGINGEKAVLKVTLIDNNGQEISVSRIVKFFGAGALDEAAQNGGSFILSDDIILEKPVEVAKGKELVLDLNGKPSLISERISIRVHISLVDCLIDQDTELFHVLGYRIVRIALFP